MKNYLSLLILIISCLIYGQSSEKLDSLLNLLSKSELSTNIVNTSEFKELSNYKSIPYFISKIKDTTETNVFSDCKNRNLTKGELSLIIIDRIEKFLPYSVITKFQNCLMTYCENNPNLIEYYFNEERDYSQYELELRNWFKSDDRRKRKKSLNNYNKKELKSQQIFFREQL